MGPICRQMLAKLVESPDGQGGFRDFEVSAAAERRGWTIWRGDLSTRVRWFEITPAGREALAAWRDRNPGRN
jgi:hypothetical protein